MAICERLFASWPPLKRGRSPGPPRRVGKSVADEPGGESVSGLPTRSGGPGQTGKEAKPTQVRKPLPQQGLEAFDFALDLL